jgi:vacuolar-type H+-ATPase subunit I/STV1
LDRGHLYETISSGASDKEGRWQAFIDYSKFYYNSLTSQKWQLRNGIAEEDIGAIEDAAFKMIRLRTLKGLPKIHQLMRKLPKLCAVQDSRKELLHLADEVDVSIPGAEQFDKEGDALSSSEIDSKWADHNRRTVIHLAKKAMESLEEHREKETPLALLEAALKKLNSDNLALGSISQPDYKKARAIVANIQKRAHEIERELYTKSRSRKPAVKRKSAGQGRRS